MTKRAVEAALFVDVEDHCSVFGLLVTSYS